jgi:hypothetical protein
MNKPKKNLKPATQKQKLEWTMKHGTFLDKVGTGIKLAIGKPLKKGGSVKKKSK